MDLKQAVKFHTGIKDHVPPGQPFDIFYDVLKPTSSSHYYYVDGNLLATRSKVTMDGDGFGHLPLGLENGDSIDVEICVNADEGGQACGAKTIAGHQHRLRAQTYRPL